MINIKAKNTDPTTRRIGPRVGGLSKLDTIPAGGTPAGIFANSSGDSASSAAATAGETDVDILAI